MLPGLSLGETRRAGTDVGPFGWEGNCGGKACFDDWGGVWSLLGIGEMMFWVGYWGSWWEDEGGCVRLIFGNVVLCLLSPSYI